MCPALGVRGNTRPLRGSQPRAFVFDRRFDAPKRCLCRAVLASATLHGAPASCCVEELASEPTCAGGHRQFFACCSPSALPTVCVRLLPRGIRGDVKSSSCPECGRLHHWISSESDLRHSPGTRHLSRFPLGAAPSTTISSSALAI